MIQKMLLVLRALSCPALKYKVVQGLVVLPSPASSSVVIASLKTWRLSLGPALPFCTSSHCLLANSHCFKMGKAEKALLTNCVRQVPGQVLTCYLKPSHNALQGHSPFSALRQNAQEHLCQADEK